MSLRETAVIHPHKRIQQAIREHMLMKGWTAPHAVTLTMKQAIQFHDGRGIVLTPEIASQNFRHFLNLLNKRVWGSAAVRFGKSVKCLCVLEGGPGKRYHYHAVIECPRDELVTSFPEMIENAWRRTDWSYHQSDIQPFSDDGWVKYISKFRDKPSYADAFDWMNCHFG